MNNKKFEVVLKNNIDLDVLNDMFYKELLTIIKSFLVNNQKE